MLAQGFETIEALTPVDVMTRCHIDVKTVSIDNNRMVRSSHGVLVEADQLLSESDLSDGDVLVLPGGFPGYKNLCENAEVGDLAKEYFESPDKYLAAICGAPTVLSTYGIAKGSEITCHSSVRDNMSEYNLHNEDIVVDRKLITGAGAGLSLKFSIEIAKHLTDEATIAHLLKGLQID